MAHTLLWFIVFIVICMFIGLLFVIFQRQRNINCMKDKEQDEIEYADLLRRQQISIKHACVEYSYESVQPEIRESINENEFEEPR